MAKNYISILAMSNINDTIPIYKYDPEKKWRGYQHVFDFDEQQRKIKKKISEIEIFPSHWKVKGKKSLALTFPVYNSF